MTRYEEELMARSYDGTFHAGCAVEFHHDGIEFLITVINNFANCFAESQYQFGFELGQDGYIESMDELIEMLICNYENGNIFIEE